MALEIRNVNLADNSGELLYDLSATFQPGLNILVGPTLAGKTTVMRLMAGLIAPDEGEVILNGQDVTKESVRNRSVSFVYQQFINYPAMSALWWQAIGSAAAGELTAQEAMDQLAAGQDEIMQRLEEAGVHSECGVKLNEERDAQYWLDQPGAPYPKLADEKGPAETVPYDELVAGWFEGRSYLG
jgi:ABC-type sugar transport system ATPase subunit